MCFFYNLPLSQNGSCKKNPKKTNLQTGEKTVFGCTHEANGKSNFEVKNTNAYQIFCLMLI